MAGSGQDTKSGFDLGKSMALGLLTSANFTSSGAAQATINLLNKQPAPEYGPNISAVQETAPYALISQTQAWKDLTKHAKEEIEPTHLRNLLADAKRDASLTVEHDGILIDYSRQRVTLKTMDLLFNLAETANVRGKIKSFASGDKVNQTEGRAAGHMALRACADFKLTSCMVDGKNVAPDVQKVLTKIKTFSEAVRLGEWKGVTGKTLTDIVAIGIGGSYLGTEYVYEAIRLDAHASRNARGRSLRFLANVDPVGVARALEGCNPETTLAIVISKTFTTAETMLNARTVKDWLVTSLGANATPKHMIAVSTNVAEVTKFGIDAQNIFEFWDWVGGRYSVCSAVGLVPLAIQFGYDVVDSFLAGARSIDTNFLTAQPRNNLALILGLIGVWNSSFLSYPTRTIAAYSQALLRFAAHIQQVDMESNGKRVTQSGTVLDFETGEIGFGEPGTNAQHSYFQLLHQGRTIPADFIGFVESQKPVELKGEAVSNHDELMSNFFAQPDALATGKTSDEIKAEGVAKEHLIPHLTFTGNRPSNVILLPRLTAYEAGQLLALYEHRTVVQGFVWGINSFDQFGVELGKVLASNVRKTFSQLRKSKSKPTAAALPSGFNPSTQALLVRYLSSATAAAGQSSGGGANASPSKL